MTDLTALYAQRLTSAAEAAALIPSGSKIAMALGVGQPPAILKAIADRAEAGQVDDLRLYYLLSTSIAGETVLRYELMDRIHPYSLFHSAIERRLDTRAHDEGRAPVVQLVPTGFQQTPRVLCQEIGVDTLVATVSPMDEDGNFSFGTNTDYAQPVSRTAKRVILEVNPHMPRVSGQSTVHISNVTAMVENAIPLLEVPKAGPQPADTIIGGLIAAMVEDGATLQMGIGALPDAVCTALKDHKNLGIHTEMLTPGLVELMKAGVVTNARKSLNPGKTVFAFCMGDRSTYDYLHENEAIEGHPVSYVNDVHVIGQNDRMVSVNATLEIDLDGACCSEHLNGRQFTGSGGQLDFVRGAYASKGGQSIIACHATAKSGTVSRIVPALSGPVTTPRNDVHIVVTEYGIANLKGLSTSQRARALIRLAAPQFREELTAQATAMGPVYARDLT
ncbi:acetyl-CoA hydrolase/transferase C-terminal domain-containing protein [Brevundimonas sp.]|uniref:acetyl-CoA hydrolase/transferase family protein n=1 Tax=Brevundimonas sp. TaxID=1871086 RepID=UPI001AD39B7A|nr:acetyl-CoA hydrolase/transferase C-terminal domain-containing protein [Brevundimonas sp.]MBN9464819.1 acetyl-CoA hydrolase/transferase family protein [Brevundimonas sp.]